MVRIHYESCFYSHVVLLKISHERERDCLGLLALFVYMFMCLMVKVVPSRVPSKSEGALNNVTAKYKNSG